MSSARLLVPLLGCAAIACGGRDAAVEPDLPEVPPRAERTVAEMVEQTLALSNYHPSEAALAARPPARGALGTKRGALTTQVGEIVVMQGNEQTVTAFDDGSYGLVLTQFVQNPTQISAELFQSYPDEFDAIVVFTTFPDQGSVDSVAWYLPIRSSVGGTGASPVDNGSFWGSASRLHGFINMQYIGQYGSGLGDPDHWLHAVMAQEFGHRWGSFARYVNGDGQISDAMLGRDGSHWASTLQAFGSVMDGNLWVETAPGTFVLEASNFRFSELDQYVMGLRGPDEVSDWFRIANARYHGNSINPAQQLPVGITISGEREDISIDQVIAAEGPRTPSHLESQRDFRVAIVLVTRPDETAQAVQPLVDRLEEVRVAFEQAAAEMSDNRMRVCTQVSAPCDSPALTLAEVEVVEDEGNGDGIIDPGEIIRLSVSATSTGFGDALDSSVEMGQANLPVQIISYQASFGDVAQGETATAAEPLRLRIPQSVGCGEVVKVPLSLRTGGRAFPAETRIEVGVEVRVSDGLERPDEWTIDPYGTDNASAGRWQIASPKGVDALYTGVNLVTQPAQDHSPSGVNALVTGPDGGEIGDNDVDDGVTTALSPEYDISGARDPILTWYSWHFSYDFNSVDGVVAVEDDPLYVEVSVDGGQTWTLVHTDTASEQGWLRRDVRLRNHVELTGRLQLRVTMGDLNKSTLNEALIDDIQIWDESLVCRPDLAEGTDGADGSDGTDATDGTDGTDGDGTDGVDDPPAPIAGDAEAGVESSGCQAGAGGGPMSGVLLLLAMIALLARRRMQRG